MNGFISDTHTHRYAGGGKSRWFQLPAANILTAALAGASLGHNQLSATITGFCRQQCN